MSKKVKIDPLVEEILSRVRPTPMVQNGLSDEEKIAKISNCFRDIMLTLGLDLEDDSLRNTPQRVAKMYVREMFSGLSPESFPSLTSIENKLGYNEMVTVKDISIISVCEHHFVTIDGRATIAYIPKDKVIGLSKINRIAKFFSRRPQVQERLTKQIADCLTQALETDDVAVYIHAKHYCVVQRGVEDAGSVTVTSDLRGAFREDARTRSEFLAVAASR
ncbi:MAG: GTP cyclohydrolase I FolE [Bdellovibrionales bacterium]|nr:GTP cyclohydrolase I FolE [Bdellovibrionales bacterium]